MTLKLPEISFSQLANPKEAMAKLAEMFLSRGVVTGLSDEIADAEDIENVDLVFSTTIEKSDENILYLSDDESDLPFRFKNKTFIKKDFEHIFTIVHEIWLSKPLYACILIGGKSSRMGFPKHLVKFNDGETWLEKTVKLLSPFVDKVVLSGEGYIPDNLSGLQRISDVEGIGGPLSGLMSCFRSYPESSWLVSACDMPLMTEESISWLLANRLVGRWGVVPNSSGPEPLFACYECCCAVMLEKLVAEQKLKVRLVTKHDKIYQPKIPKELLIAWSNINTPDTIPNHL